MADTSRSFMLQQFKTRLQDKDSVLDILDLEDALDAALEEYSGGQLRERVHDIPGDGSTTTFSLPSDWQEIWSRILSVELPKGQEPASYLTSSGYSLYRDTNDTLKLRFASAPASGDTARVLYTTVQTASSMPGKDRRAVATLAAAIGLQWIANYYAAQADSSFGSDVAAHTERSERYAARAKEMRERYKEMVPVRRRTRLEVVRV